MSLDVSEWLGQLELNQYTELFVENEITWDLLTELDHELLSNIGISIAGHRLRIIKAVRSLEAEACLDLSESRNAKRPIMREEMQAERRQVTVLFCDMVGSTALSQSMDPEKYRDIITEYRSAVAAAINHYDGYIGNFMGDGLKVYFGYPQAHEDDAERAVHAGLAIVEQISKLQFKDVISLHVRIGISTGIVVAGDIVGAMTSEIRAVMGDTPNLAARLQSIAEPDTVVISDSTRKLLNNRFTLVPLGCRKLKGISEPVPVFKVGVARIVETRFAAANSIGQIEMVGREQELNLLLDKWERAKVGKGQFVVLKGEAGIGKSCVTNALIANLTQEGHQRIIYQCSPYHSDTALYPTIQQMKFASGIKLNDSPETALDKLELLLHQGQEDISQSAPLLGSLLGIGDVAEARYGLIDFSPQLKRERTLQNLVEQLVGVSQNRPVLFVLEDAHWMDPTTLELLELALCDIGNHRIMLLLTARPSFNDIFVDSPIVSKLTLNRLGQDQVNGIIERIAKGKSLPSTLQAKIAAKSDGVPLFVEEITKTLLESGQLQEINTGYHFDGELDQLSLPNSLHDSLMARLDRMSSAKEVAQTAACIGRDFNYSLLEAISPLVSIQLKTALQMLFESEVVFVRGSPPDSKYVFKHALVRDAAYGSLLKTTQVTIHLRILEHLAVDESTAPELLAHHATAAGDLSKAVEYWDRAGNQAAERSAFSEAISHYQRATYCIQSLVADSETRVNELELLVKLSNASAARYGYSHPNTVAAKATARLVLDKVDETPHRIPVLYSSWVANHAIGNHMISIRDANELCAVTEKIGDREQELVAHRLRGSTYFMMGELSAADSSFSTAFALIDASCDAKLASKYGYDPGVAVRVCWAMTLLCRGEADHAMEIIAGVEEDTEKLDHAHAYAFTLSYLSYLMEMGKLPDQKRLTLLSRDIAEKYDLKMWYAYSCLYFGAFLHDEGHFIEALKQVELGLKLTQESHAKLTMPYHYAIYASSLSSLGRFDEASEIEKIATRMINEGSEQLGTAEIYRLLAINHYKQHNINSDAVNRLLLAKQIAKRQGAKLWDLRASVSLTRIWTELDERVKGLELLTSAVENFPPGGKDLPDMLTARSLLEEIS